jgi:sporulation protein YqfC
MGDKLNKISSILETDQILDSRIEIFGRKKIVIEGCFGIRDYSEEVVSINMSKYTLVIMGDNLSLQNMQQKNITITGKILSIEFEVL